MKLESLFKKYQKKIDYKKSDEYILISKYKNKTGLNKILHTFYKKNEPFDLILGAVIINAYKNKVLIEKKLKEYQGKSNNQIDSLIKKDLKKYSLSYFKKAKIEYYVPLFSYSLNYVYSFQPHLLYLSPYNEMIKEYDSLLVDLFEDYNFDLFDSNFTRLIKIGECNNTKAFYHPYFKTLFFINEQGKLEYEIRLFDKYLTNTSSNHQLEKLSIVSKYYFENDREKFIKSLIDNKLISKTLIDKNEKIK